RPSSRFSSESGRWRSSHIDGQAFMVAVALLSVDPALCRRFEQLPQCDPSITVVDVVAHSSDLLSLLARREFDVVLMDDPTRDQLERWKDAHNQTPLLVLLEAGKSQNIGSALDAGAAAIVDRSAALRNVIAAIAAARSGF